jgi:hypothetical protein
MTTKNYPLSEISALTGLSIDSIKELNK